MEKKIDLCGLGNSLVDIQVNVDFGVIDSLGLNKGEMKLTDIAEQKAILEKVRESGTNLCSGGSAANTIIAFAGFGGKAAYMSVLGNDENGKFYSGEFENLGIELKADYLDTDPTGTCLVLITPDGERTMCTSLGATGKFTLEHLSEEIIAMSKWLYLEGYKFTSQPSTDAIFKAVEIAEKNGVKIALTFSDVFITNLFREPLTRVAEKSDLIFCNENEALSFTGVENLEIAYGRMKEMTRNYVITLGNKGALINWNGTKIEIPAYPTKPIDTTGAGDMFAGGFIYGLCYHDDPSFAGNLGSFAASRIVSQMGARLNDDYDEVLRFVIDNWKNKTEK